jgi:hypothetical protein
VEQTLTVKFPKEKIAKYKKYTLIHIDPKQMYTCENCFLAAVPCSEYDCGDYSIWGLLK